MAGELILSKPKGYGVNDAFGPVTNTAIAPPGAPSYVTTPDSDNAALLAKIDSNDPLYNPIPQMGTVARQNILSQNNLLPGQKALDQDTQLAISGEIQHASDPSAISANLMQGTGDARGLISTPEQMTNHATALGMNLPGGFTSAMDQMNQKNIGSTLSGLQRNAGYQAELQKAQALQSASGQLSQQEQLKNQNYQQQVDYAAKKQALDLSIQIAQNQANTSILTSILTGVGKVVGAIAAA